MPLHDKDTLIRERAYHIWEADGCPEGRDAEHWVRAQREIEAQRSATEPELSAAPSRPGRKPLRRTAAQRGKAEKQGR